MTVKLRFDLIKSSFMGSVKFAVLSRDSKSILGNIKMLDPEDWHYWGSNLNDNNYLSDTYSNQSAISLTKLNFNETFRSYSDEEAEILKKQIHIPRSNSNYSRFFHLIERKEKRLIGFGIFASVFAGAGLPVSNLLLIKLVNQLYRLAVDELDPDETQIIHLSMVYIYLGIVVQILTFASEYIFVFQGHAILTRFRKQYFEAILRQNTAYFDINDSAELTNRIFTDTYGIQETLFTTFPKLIRDTAVFILATVVGFVCSWKIMLIIEAPVMIILVGTTAISKWLGTWQRSETSYTISTAAVICAQYVISSVKTWIHLGAEDRIANKFEDLLAKHLPPPLRKKIPWAFCKSFAWATPYLALVLYFWVSLKLYTNSSVSIGKIVAAIGCVVLSARSISNVLGNVLGLTHDQSSLEKLFQTIDRKCPVDQTSNSGIHLARSVIGGIKLEGINFAYPTAPNTLILENCSIRINPKQTVALIGADNSGKSTILNLIERFYLPLSGKIFIDNYDISEINTNSLRRNMATVLQGFELFDGTVYENVVIGLNDSNEYLQEDQKRALVIKACKSVNAWGFVLPLPNGLDTQVGSRGHKLTTSQRQRICIARAMVREPKILLMDEPTSSLGIRGSNMFYSTLKQLTKNTTVVVATNKPSYGRYFDKIFVIGNGTVIEEGTHEELANSNGHYASLLKTRKLDQERGLAEGKSYNHTSTQTSCSAIPYFDSQENPILDWQKRFIKDKPAMRIMDSAGDRRHKARVTPGYTASFLAMVSLSQCKGHIIS
ncbi:hypothetical protein TRICI_004136 [Trichomonascus ciferrii]|uniref:Uncharacterized protein n=1 Tax=Trichomonascus ciferrii TaxID=44093 RepID=A0A642V1M4_9ASCO|nr:hypothetical protein TRICI_004136 [Trichomonascus ciferrii]